MTFKSAGRTTTDRCVAAALSKVVEDACFDGRSLNSRALDEDPATSAKVYRYFHALTWFRAEEIIRIEKMTDPSPEAFMPMFREEAVSRVAQFFPGMGPGGDKLLRSVLRDDTEAMPILVARVMARRPFHVAHAIFLEWMTTQGARLDPESQISRWVRSSAAASAIRDRVGEALRPRQQPMR